MTKSLALLSCCLISAVLISEAAISTARAEEANRSDSIASLFLQKYCIDCHGADTQEADLNFQELSIVTAANSQQWQIIWEQVALRQMPPQDETNQPSAMERLQLSHWITGNLVQARKEQGGFQTHLLPSKGNHLDHELLFGPLPPDLAPTSTPARIWRIHPQEHLTRLNALINREPEFDPARPGLRTRGDQIPPNEEGEIKVYYGLDRVIGWVGGTAAYAAAITGFPPMLSTDDLHGLRNYPIMYSVNGSEAMQITTNAEEILRFMAYGPKAEPYQFADKVSQIDQKYKHESLRGLSQSLFYGKTPKRPMTPIYDLMHEPGVSDKNLTAAVNYLFEALTLRPPTQQETATYVELARQSITDLGKEEGAILGLTPIFLDRDALFRPELAQSGTPDQYGRVMLQDQELALAINAAFCYIAPDQTMLTAANEGRLKTRADAQREVTRILQDDSIRKPRVLQFFREYFDYDRAGYICKDNKALISAGGDNKAQAHYRAMFGMTANTDRLVELILQEDKQVLYELLTTERVVYDPAQDNRYFGEYVGLDKSRPKQAKKAPAADKKKKPPALPQTIRAANLPPGDPIHVRIAQVVTPVKTQRTLTTLPVEQRAGILTHPSWLVSHSDAMDNHAILRGRWIRERLLGDAVPDVPITVNAMLPDEPRETLRHRMRVTREEYCWKCHQKMDPLGLPFEMFNHIGLYRNQDYEPPVDTSGEIINSGEASLDGPVDNALDMIRKLAESERVKQVFVRHAFRFWIGRNETINDAPVLQDAYRAYVENEGSMNALLASLLTSDAFLFRHVERDLAP